MPRDIDDQPRRQDRAREHGEITGEERRDRNGRDPAAGGSGPSDDTRRPGTHREREDRRSTWDHDEDMQEGYR
ncbi:hypothetical protein ACFSL4_32575 [Streptomyces caeni]|uniref:Uncharacterized protein n=1 Tax=Streptomyces caeni TaxID=2307231 RepID=A0ABW4IZT9_9ACTN